MEETLSTSTTPMVKIIVEYKGEVYSLVPLENDEGDNCEHCDASCSDWCNDMHEVLGCGCDALAQRLGKHQLNWRKH